MVDWESTLKRHCVGGAGPGHPCGIECVNAEFLGSDKTILSRNTVEHASGDPTCKSRQASSTEQESQLSRHNLSSRGQPRGDTGPVCAELAASRHFLPTPFPALATNIKDRLPAPAWPNGPRQLRCGSRRFSLTFVSVPAPLLLR